MVPVMYLKGPKLGLNTMTLMMRRMVPCTRLASQCMIEMSAEKKLNTLKSLRRKIMIF